MKTIMTLALIVIPAFYTGQNRQFTTITGRHAISCEYRMSDGRKFWKTFEGYTCPQSVEVY